MVKEAIILAGGLGTRLSDILPGLPKCMAPVGDHPFLTYVIRQLISQGIERFIFSLGHKHEVIEEFLECQFPTIRKKVVIESKPLQTGGAIQWALSASELDDVLIVNGDTLFKVDIQSMYQFHKHNQADCTIALKPMTHFDRYGSVITDTAGRVLTFEEKKETSKGNINGGVYILQKNTFLSETWPEVFSFEIDYLGESIKTKRIFGCIQDRYFIDIGIPSDYVRAREELKYPPIPIEQLDKTWTLFLDRDGVINVNKPDSYVFNASEFVFEEKALQALRDLSMVFGRIFVITNQRGVGKGLMTEEDLQDIHIFMQKKIEQAGGRIDDIFYCTSVDNQHPDRKPNPGMAFKAKAKYPDIDLEKSIMIGDKGIDLQWGRNIGARTVWIYSESLKGTIPPSDIDLTCGSLFEFAQRVKPGV